MIVNAYEDAADFLQRVLPDLETEEAVNNLMIGIAGRVRDHPERFKGPAYMSTVEEGGELLAAGLMTPPYNLIVFSPKKSEPALRLIARHLLSEGWQAPGVLAEADTAAVFARLFSEVSGRKARLDMHERIYVLKTVTPPSSVPGCLRLARPEEVPLLAGWGRAFMEETGLREGLDDMDAVMAARVKDGALFVWDVDGRPVSMAQKTRPTRRGICIGFVYTPPEERSHGYASALVAALSQHLLDEGRDFCILFTNLANPISNHIYQEIGYRPVCDYDLYKFE